LDPVTISPTDLVLEKTQIHEINEKDIKDLVTLFAACTLSDEEGRGKISRRHIADVLSDDWGFWYDARTNLDKVAHFAQRYEQEAKLDSELLQKIMSKIGDLHRTIEATPKSNHWQKRSRNGASKKWWNDVEERHR
jgi:hypothetical protein